MLKFKDKVAVITGAAGGIGTAIVRKFASQGAKVGIFDLNIDRAGALAAEVIEAGGEAVAVKVDVSDAAEVENAFYQVVKRFDKVDILINNAGITRDNLLYKMTENDWDTVMDVHLKGSFLCAREAQKYMVSNKYGKIVNLSSTSALGNRGQLNYSAAKAGLQGFTKTLAFELGPFGVNVNAIAPGFIETEMTKVTAERIGVPFEAFSNRIIEGLCIKRVGQPEDIANVAAFLCSDESSYVTGQVIYVSGKPNV